MRINFGLSSRGWMRAVLLFIGAQLALTSAWAQPQEIPPDD